MTGDQWIDGYGQKKAVRSARTSSAAIAQLIPDDQRPATRHALVPAAASTRHGLLRAQLPEFSTTWQEQIFPNIAAEIANDPVRAHQA